MLSTSFSARQRERNFHRVPGDTLAFEYVRTELRFSWYFLHGIFALNAVASSQRNILNAIFFMILLLQQTKECFAMRYSAYISHALLLCNRAGKSARSGAAAQWQSENVCMYVFVWECSFASGIWIGFQRVLKLPHELKRTQGMAFMSTKRP